MAQSDDKDFKLPDDVNVSNLVSDLQVKVSDITRKATIRDVYSVSSRVRQFLQFMGYNALSFTRFHGSVFPIPNISFATLSVGKPCCIVRINGYLFLDNLSLLNVSFRIWKQT